MPVCPAVSCGCMSRGRRIYRPGPRRSSPRVTHTGTPPQLFPWVTGRSTRGPHPNRPASRAVCPGRGTMGAWPGCQVAVAQSIPSAASCSRCWSVSLSRRVRVLLIQVPSRTGPWGVSSMWARGTATRPSRAAYWVSAVMPRSNAVPFPPFPAAVVAGAVSVRRVSPRASRRSRCSALRVSQTAGLVCRVVQVPTSTPLTVMPGSSSTAPCSSARRWRVTASWRCPCLLLLEIVYGA